jgi:poly(beta-D-mannuronate) lyase
MSIDYTAWYLTLPTGERQGRPDRVFPPALAALNGNPYFQRARDSVTFTAPTRGIHTQGSKYCRSELRELDKTGQLAAWSMGDGARHTLSLEQAVTMLPPEKPGVVVAQIHDGSDEVIAVWLSKRRLEVVHDATDFGVLDNDYALGSRYSLRVDVDGDGQVKVSYSPENGQEKTVVCKGVQPRKGRCFFKAGAYVQSNEEGKEARARVKIYRATLSHGARAK